MKKTVLFVIGTRPEAIKLAPVIKRLRESESLSPVVCLTGQHRQMLDQSLEVFGIAADEDLDVMRPDQDLTDLTSNVLLGMRTVLQRRNPWVVVVQGDTTTAMAAALGAYYAQIPVGHVEAGLRTGDPLNPYPEEMNRAIIGRLASLHFAPTQGAVDALTSEGIDASSIHLTGNTVVDALFWARDMVRDSGPEAGAENIEVIPRPVRQVAADDSKRLILVTGHRRESFGSDFENICQALARVAQESPDVEIVYPVHLNPNVQEPVNRILGAIPRVHLIEPIPYLAFVWLMTRCHLVLSDSGGVQEEAPSLGKPVLVMRKVTERPEGIEAGCARLVGVDTETIVANVKNLLTDSSAYAQMSGAVNPYGDGEASRRIVAALEKMAARA